MDVQPSSLTRINQPELASTAPVVEDTSALSSDFDTFLQLLTAQLENQDPLSPTDSTEWVAQLATFSSVEQQTLSNQWLEAMYNQSSLSGLSELAGWVGMEARVATTATFDGVNPVTVSPNPPVAADRVELVAYNEFGSEVWRGSLPVSAEAYEWNPTDANGASLPAGQYDLKIESYAEDALLVTDVAEVYTTVTEVRSIAGSPALVLQGGAIVEASTVTAIRQDS